MSELFFCLNQVSYVVAGEHLLQRDPGSGTLYLDRVRVRPKRRYSNLRHEHITRYAIVRELALAAVLRPEHCLIPHHSTGRLIQALASRARSVGFVDDGLDTLRDVPKNIDLDRVRGMPQLLTFTDYESIGSWTTAFERVGVCQLASLAEDDRPALDLSRFGTVVIESPGVRNSFELVGGQHAHQSAMYVVHPSPIKRLRPPPGVQIFPTAEYSLEKSLLTYSGRVVLGETMLLPFLLFCCESRKMHLVVQLSHEQYGNLKPLHERLSRSAAELMLF